MRAMARPGRLRWRLMLATAAVAILPLLVAIVVARSMVRKATDRFFAPEIGQKLEQSLGLYQELAKAIKLSMRNAADAIAARQKLRDAAVRRDIVTLNRELAAQIASYPGLVRLAVFDSEGEVIVDATRGREVDDATEKKLELQRELSDLGDDGPQLLAVFVTERARLDELASMGQFVDTYRKIEQRRYLDEKSYVEAFSVLLALTVLISCVVGYWLARDPTVRLAALASAIRRLGSGDLATRVPERGNDEISDLSRAFNRMVAEIEASRARIEYLQRIGAWQEMARRLAHEIKNPLTPIQLAVQEVHRRCPVDNPTYQRLVNDTLQIVEDEVETLRHLVSAFSSFARMPQAQLKLCDLALYLRKHERVFQLLEEDPQGSEPSFVRLEASISEVTVQVSAPASPCPAYIDAHMFKRAIINLVRNAVQAIVNTGRADGQVLLNLSAEAEGFWDIDVDDDGPGIPDDIRATIFDPYVTTKRSGTGLGLAIVKKIIIEHGGTIEATSSPVGGARMRIRLPRPCVTTEAFPTDTALEGGELDSKESASTPPSAKA